MISSSRKRCREKGRILFEGSRKEGAVLLDGLREVFVIGEEGLGRVIRRRHGWYSIYLIANCYPDNDGCGQQRRRSGAKEGIGSPVSKLPMMVSAPNLAFFHAPPWGTPPGPASPRNCHDRVVCRLRPRLGNTEITPGCPGQRRSGTSRKLLVSSFVDGRVMMKMRDGTKKRRSPDGGEEGRLHSLAISAAAAASRLAAKPLMCLVYE
jgi:hypothetical protein